MDGIILINKATGYSSQDVVSKVKKILNIKRAGHTGTLDPMATGVLPILLGSSTKLSKYLIEHDKTYVASIKLGEKRDTGDSEGKVLETRKVKNEYLAKESIEIVLRSFLGKQKQIPPMYSAIKVKGRKLYEYARNGEKVEVPERNIEIYDIKLESIDITNKEILFEVSCSKGTYVRVLCENIAEKIGTVGYMSSLVRTKVDRFVIEQSATLEELEENNYEIISMEELFNEYERIVLNERKLELFLNGVKLTYKLKNGIYNIYTETDMYMGIGVIENQLLKRDIVL